MNLQGGGACGATLFVLNWLNEWVWLPPHFCFQDLLFSAYKKRSYLATWTFPFSRSLLTTANNYCCSAIILVDYFTHWQRSSRQMGLTSISWGKLKHTVVILKQEESDGRRGPGIFPAMGVLCTWIEDIFTGRVNTKLLRVSSSLKEDCWWV